MSGEIYIYLLRLKILYDVVLINIYNLIKQCLFTNGIIPLDSDYTFKYALYGRIMFYYILI